MTTYQVCSQARSDARCICTRAVVSITGLLPGRLGQITPAGCALGNFWFHVVVPVVVNLMVGGAASLAPAPSSTPRTAQPRCLRHGAAVFIGCR